MIRPAGIINRNCSLNGITVTGTLLDTPTAISAVKNAHSFVLHG